MDSRTNCRNTHSSSGVKRTSTLHDSARRKALEGEEIEEEEEEEEGEEEKERRKRKKGERKRREKRRKRRKRKEGVKSVRRFSTSNIRCPVSGVRCHVSA